MYGNAAVARPTILPAGKHGHDPRSHPTVRGEREYTQTSSSLKNKKKNNTHTTIYKTNKKLKCVTSSNHVSNTVPRSILQLFNVFLD